MEEKTNLTQEQVFEVIKDFNIEPLFSKVIITLNSLEIDGSLVLSDNTLSEEQYVVAKGSAVRELEPGQKVIIDIEKMMVTVRSESTNAYEEVKQVKIDPIVVNNVVYAIIEDRLIKAKFKK
jgi:hypothetical protein